MFRRRNNSNQLKRQASKREERRKRVQSLLSVPTSKLSKRRRRERIRKEEKRKLNQPRPVAFTIYQNKIKEEKKGKGLKFVIRPILKVLPYPLPRVAEVIWGRRKAKEYHFDHFVNTELEHFWKLDDRKKQDYIKANFDEHHRRPRCQSGPSNADNLSYVDIVSHRQFNKIVETVAKWRGLDIKKVYTKDIASFLWNAYPTLEKLFLHPITRRLKSLEIVLHEDNIDCVSRAFVFRIVAPWAGLNSNMVQLRDIRNFLRQIYPPIKRLAYDHESDELRRVQSFATVLNTIWLPKDDQIVFKR